MNAAAKEDRSRKHPVRRPAARLRKAPQGRQALFPVVGIGASAGGLEAVTALLHALPPMPGMALALVQHLDPTHESAMAALLSRATSMPVLEARNNLELECDHVYVIPPNKLMEIANRRLKLLSRVDSKAANTPIDHFFKSLAEYEGSRAVGVILSGSGGGDGTQGLLAMKAAGGITFAQDEKSAKYPSMPAAAVAAGCVDFVLPPEKIAKELTRLAGHPYIAPVARGTGGETASGEKEFEDILHALRVQTGVDFSQYKRATLQRRIQRRMALHKIETLKEYAAYLHGHAAEVRELFTDVLIHVTSFFRDPSVFQALKRRVFPRLVKKRPPEEQIRIWVPGCSTGEEVYSLAIAIMEFLGEKKTHFPVQFFGTDINEAALDRARAGTYPDSIRSDVTAERLRRFFVRTEAGYRVNKSIREMCIFARQNVVNDPPFSNIDLISCRNVLIYLGPVLQRRVMPLFHYALKPAGYLLLGASETIGGFAELFGLMEKKGKVYAKKATQMRPAVTFVHAPLEPVAERMTAGPAARTEISPSVIDVQKQADRIVLTQHSPAGVVVNRQLEVLQFRGRTGPFLEHAHGEATLNLLKMAREGLMVGLRAAVGRAMRQNVHVREAAVPVKQNGGTVDVDIEVVPFQAPPSRERFYLVLFQETARARQGAPRGQGRTRKTAESAETRRLREELASTRESLQAIIEEQEATNEELRSANEEIMSSNEELQSTNEELETAKEELQSTNEELATLNDELENRNTEMEHVNNDLHNLLASVNIPIIMVGPDLRIRRFTAVAERVFNLIPADVGRPVTDINLKVNVNQLGVVLGDVIDTLQTRDIEVQDAGGHWWSLRVRPYKTTDNKIDGAVIALLDIDMLKTSMEGMRQSQAFAEAVVNAVRQPLVVLGKDLVVQSANDAFYDSFQLKPEDTIERRIYQVGGGQWDIPRLRTLLEDMLPHNSRFDDFEIEHVFPAIGRRKMRLYARRITSSGGQAMILLAFEVAQ
ncbi:histidine kinase [bacterium]|nr:histidine kinase [bacterium]